MSFPASAYCMVMKALWSVVALRSSLRVAEVGVIVYVRAKKSARERTHLPW